MTDNSTVTQPVSTIALNNGAGAVSVHTGGNAIVIDRRINYRSGTKPAPGQELHDGTLTLTAGCSECGIQYDLIVPPSVGLKIVDDAGNVAIDGVAGQVSVTAQEGAVTATSLGSSVVRTYDAAGAIQLSFAHPPRLVNAHSEAGAVAVTVPGGSYYNVDATATAGQKTINVPTSPTAPSTLILSSLAGNVRVGKA
jgi:hypothetical protein